MRKPSPPRLFRHMLVCVKFKAQKAVISTLPQGGKKPLVVYLAFTGYQVVVATSLNIFNVNMADNILDPAKGIGWVITLSLIHI